jgi:hypothetical protein
VPFLLEPTRLFCQRIRLNVKKEGQNGLINGESFTSMLLGFQTVYDKFKLPQQYHPCEF